MKNKKHKLPVLLIIICGAVASISMVLLWRDNQKLKETNNTLLKSNEVHRKLVENEYKSYQAINECFVLKKGLCDPEDFKSKMQTLGDEAESFYNQISILDEQIQVQRHE